MRADLEDDLDALIAAVPALTPVASRRAVTGARKRVLPSEEQFAALMARLGVSLPVVLNLVDGKREPSPEEAAALRDIVGVTPEVTPPPAELVIEMYHPRWKATVLDLARRRDMKEAAARAVMASGAFALAARQTGNQPRTGASGSPAGLMPKDWGGHEGSARRGDRAGAPHA